MAINKTVAGTFAVDFRDQHKRRFCAPSTLTKRRLILRRKHSPKSPRRNTSGASVYVRLCEIGGKEKLLFYEVR